MGAPDGEEPVAKKVKKPEVASDRQESTTTIGKENKEKESAATDIQKHVKQKKYQKPNGGQQPTPAPDGEEPLAKKVKKPEVASDRQESTTTIGKGNKEKESGATDIQKHVKQKKYQKPHGGPAPDGEEPLAKKVKKPEFASDRQESTTTIGKKTKKRK